MKVSKTITAVFAVTTLFFSSAYAAFQPQERAILAPLGPQGVRAQRTSDLGRLGPVATQMQSNYTGSYSQSNPPTAQDLQNAWYGMDLAQQVWLAGTSGALGVTAVGADSLYTGQNPGSVDFSLVGTPSNYYQSEGGSIPYTGQYPGTASLEIIESDIRIPLAGYGARYSSLGNGSISYTGQHPDALAVSLIGTPGVSSARYYYYNTYTGDFSPNTGEYYYPLSQISYYINN